MKKYFDLFTELLGWLFIFASPFLIGLVLAAIIYFSNPSSFRLILSIIFLILGIIVGVAFATKKFKSKEGTIWFISMNADTSELDNSVEAESKKDN